MKTKTVKNIALFVFIAFLVSGCVKNYDSPEKTRKGKVIHDAWHKGIDATFQRYIDIAFAFNTWYNAPLSQKDSIEDAYFLQYKIRHLQNDQWGLYYNANLAYRIDRQYKSLSEANAFWVVEAVNPTLDSEDDHDYGNYFYGYEFVSFIYDDITTIYINSIGANEWHVQVDPSVPFSNLEINIKSIDSSAFASLYDSPFVWSGKGVFLYAYNSIAYIHFETVEDIVCHPQGRKTNNQNNDNTYYYNYSYSERYPYEKSLFHWSAGKVSLNTINSEETDTVKVDASFSKLTNTRYRVDITYKGIAGKWIEDWGQ